MGKFDGWNAIVGAGVLDGTAVGTGVGGLVSFKDGRVVGFTVIDNDA